jgi:ribosomal protein S27AE
MFRIGTEDAAQAVGVLAGIAVAASLWRRSVAEGERASLDRLICPRCGSTIEATHEHAGASQPGGLQLWSCARCGYNHAEALTCEGCGR